MDDSTPLLSPNRQPVHSWIPMSEIHEDVLAEAAEETKVPLDDGDAEPLDDRDAEPLDDSFTVEPPKALDLSASAPLR